MEIVLYYAPITCALAPYITLTEANAEFEVRPLNFRKGQNKSADYLKINPKHKVPLLMVDGETLTESTAIEDQDKEIALRSGQRRAKIKSIIRV